MIEDLLSHLWIMQSSTRERRSEWVKPELSQTYQMSIHERESRDMSGMANKMFLTGELEDSVVVTNKLRVSNLSGAPW